MIKSMDCHEALELAALNALDVLDAAERASLEQHVAGCADCSRELEALKLTVDALAYAAPPTALNPDTKARLFKRIQAPPAGVAPTAATPASPSAGSTPVPVAAASRMSAAPADPGMRPGEPKPGLGWTPLFAACALVFAVGLGAMWTRLVSVQEQLARSEAHNQELTAHVAQADEQLGRMRGQSLVVAQDADLLAMKDVRMVQLEPQPAMQSAQAWVYWSPARHAWLVTFRGLPAAGPHKTYQLWAVTPDKKLSMGTFEADANGVARVRGDLPAGGKPMAAAVSVEPEGGVPAPTGPIVMVGPIKQL